MIYWVLDMMQHVVGWVDLASVAHKATIATCTWGVTTAGRVLYKDQGCPWVTESTAGDCVSQLVPHAGEPGVDALLDALRAHFPEVE